MYPYRVFISYAHEDRDIVERIVKVLSDRGLEPVWDYGLQPGKPFTDEIKELIATVHLFMPVLTPHSESKPWVLQETGFAVGIDVPVLPVALKDCLPGQMIAALQAVCVKEDLSDLEDLLREVDIELLIIGPEAETELQRLNISHRVADLPERRTQLLVNYAESIRTPAHVRQRAIFSSFSLPRGDVHGPAWNAFKQAPRRSDFYCKLLRRERQALDRHARASGCTLIVAPPAQSTEAEAPGHQVQLRELLAFLESMPDDKVTIAVSEREIEGNLTLVGDWFGARALPAQPGSDYRQTLFSRHGPTVLRWLREIEEEVRELLAFQEIEPVRSREPAMARLRERLRSYGSSP